MKSPRQKIFFILFVFVSISHLASFLLVSESLESFTKPLIIPLLLGFFRASGFQGSAKNLVFGALIFSWLGDVLLMNQETNPLFFMLGLGAFLIAHIFYVVSYTKAVSGNKGAPSTYVYGVTALFVAYGAFFMWKLWPNLGDMQLPVGVYAVVITSMLCTAAYRLGRTNSESFKWVILGAIAFVTSDSLLAVNKFIEPVPMAGLFIMITYILAQFSIVWGIIKHNHLSD